MDREERLEALEELRKKAAAVAEPIHELLLQDIARRVRGAGAITSTAEYQIYRAEQLGLAEKEIKKAISEQLQVSDTVIDALFEDMADLTAEFSDNGQLQQLVEAYSTVSRRAAAEDFDNLWAPGPDGKLYTVKEAYGKIMDFAYMQTATGALDYQTAIRRSLKELLQRGIRTIPRADGRSMRIEYAVRQYLVNRMGEMHNAISQMNYETIGADGWEISAHAAPAPDHAPYQGHQYSAEEYEQINGSLERKFGWWGCMHTVYPILLGISEPAYSDEQLQRYLDENEAGVTYEGQHYTLYEAKARKRQLESLITSTKYDVMAAEGDPEWLRTTQLRLSRIRQEYNRFCQATGQTPEPWRTMAAEYGRSRASRDAWAARKLDMDLRERRLKTAMRQQLDALTAEEREQVTRYTGFDATAINQRISIGRLNEATRKKIELLDKALSKGTIPEAVTLYRETALSYLQFEDGITATRETIQDRLNLVINNSIFTSTSFRPLDLPLRDTVLELKVPAGYKGALYIRDLAHPQYKQQDEVLFGRGLRYKVLSVDTSGKKIYIKAEVIPNE